MTATHYTLVCLGGDCYHRRCLASCLVIMAVALALSCVPTIDAYQVARIAAPGVETAAASYTLLGNTHTLQVASNTFDSALFAVPLVVVDKDVTYSADTPFTVHSDGGGGGGSGGNVVVSLPSMQDAIRFTGTTVDGPATSPHVLHWVPHQQTQYDSFDPEENAHLRMDFRPIGVWPFHSDRAEWLIAVRAYAILGPEPDLTPGFGRDSIEYGFEIVAIPLHERSYVTLGSNTTTTTTTTTSQHGANIGDRRTVRLLTVRYDMRNANRKSPEVYKYSGWERTAHCEWHIPQEPNAFTCMYLQYTRTYRVPIDTLGTARDPPTPPTPPTNVEYAIPFSDTQAAERDVDAAQVPYDDSITRVALDGTGVVHDDAWRMRRINSAPHVATTLELDYVTGGVYGTRVYASWGEYPPIIPEWRTYPGDPVAGPPSTDIGGLFTGFTAIRDATDGDGFVQIYRSAFIDMPLSEIASGPDGWDPETDGWGAFSLFNVYVGRSTASSADAPERLLSVVIAFRDEVGADCRQMDEETVGLCRIEISYRYLQWTSEDPDAYGTVPVATWDEYHRLSYTYGGLERNVRFRLPHAPHTTYHVESGGEVAILLIVTLDFGDTSGYSPIDVPLLLFPDQDRFIALPVYEYTLGKGGPWSPFYLLHTPATTHPCKRLQEAATIHEDERHHVPNASSGSAPGDPGSGTDSRDASASNGCGIIAVDPIAYISVCLYLVWLVLYFADA